MINFTIISTVQPHPSVFDCHLPLPGEGFRVMKPFRQLNFSFYFLLIFRVVFFLFIDFIFRAVDLIVRLIDLIFLDGVDFIVRAVDFIVREDFDGFLIFGNYFYFFVTVRRFLILVFFLFIDFIFRAVDLIVRLIDLIFLDVVDFIVRAVDFLVLPVDFIFLDGEQSTLFV